MVFLRRNEKRLLMNSYSLTSRPSYSSFVGLDSKFSTMLLHPSEHVGKHSDGAVGCLALSGSGSLSAGSQVIERDAQPTSRLAAARAMQGRKRDMLTDLYYARAFLMRVRDDST